MSIKLMTGAAVATGILAGSLPAAAQSFQDVVETFYHDEFRAHPIKATDIGVHDYDAEVDDLSRDGQNKNAARLHKALDDFTAIDPATLSAGDRDDREMLINSIKGKLLDVETIRYWQKDPNVYVRSATSVVFDLVHRDFAPLADRLRSVLAREGQIPMLLATSKANIEHLPRAFVDIAIRKVAGSIDFLKTGAPVAFAAVEDQQLKREFTTANDSAIAAFENYKTYLEQELKLKADGDFALGSDLFAKRMAYNEMVDLPPERLLDMAYAQLHKDQGALSEAAREVNPTAPIEAVLKEIRAQHPSADTLIPTTRDGLAGLALLRDCRFVASIEMHTKGKSVDDAIQIFTKECGSPEPEARREAYRGTRDPGYINYTVGKLEILKLRDDCRAKMGDKFSLTDFHDRLLAGGLVPIKIIRREMMGADGPVL
jgi:hypothetical protein